LHAFFNPGAVAVIGASKKPGKVGNVLIKNIMHSGYQGAIFPVNPKEEEIEGFRCYPSIKDVPDEVDLAVIAVPAPTVNTVAEACGRAGVKFLIVISAGFKEIGTEGLEREKELVATVRRYGMRMLGPNCVGMMDTHTPINASFGATFASRGEIAFISQSGAMLVAILDWSQETGLGFSKCISLGNKGDLNEADLIQYVAEDPATKVIACYLEDVTNGEVFLQVAAEAVRKKPLIILKAGASQAGARAASSHTGALAGSDLAYEVAFRQCGIVRARSMAELFDLAVAFAHQPLPRSERVALVTNAGGPGIVATDAVEGRGLKMAQLGKRTLDALRKELPREASIYNPIDVLGDAGADRYSVALAKVMEDKSVDSVIVLVCPTALAQPEDTAKVIIDVHRQYPTKPICSVFMGGASLAGGVRMLGEAGIPCYVFPEVAVNTIAGLVTYTRARERVKDEALPVFKDVDPERVRRTFEAVKKDNRLVLLGSEGAEVVQAYGIPAAPIKLATRAEEAVAIAEELGYPVVLKVASPKIIHKTDIGGVKVGLASPAEVMAGFWAVTGNVQRYLPGVNILGIEVQKMMPKGKEVIIGMTRDVQFGPMLAFGLGGIYVNLIKDVAFRLARGLSRKEARAMITETKAFTLLRGYRGEEPADIDALANIILRVARLVLDFPVITEMDINPVFAYKDGASALDVKITIT